MERAHHLTAALYFGVSALEAFLNELMREHLKAKVPLVEPLPEDYYDTFHGRGQDEQDLHDEQEASKPPAPPSIPGAWPFPGRKSEPLK